MTATTEAIDLAVLAAEAASDKLAERVVAFDVSDQLYIADIFLLCSASNDRQVRAVVDAIEERLLQEGVKRLRREGETERRWVLLDFGDLVVHVQLNDDREYYDLERLWKDCPVVPLPESAQGRPHNAAGGR
ncbi:MAG: ribosome silencing factor [Streptosporangiales bacterium]|nr:ribosome silencing factor [Streptosporangiales bacterium]